MARTKDMSSYEIVALPWTSRVVNAGKAVGALVFSISQFWLYLVPFYLSLFLGHVPKGLWDTTAIAPADPLAPMGHALMVGLALGYTMRESRHAVQGYKRVWRPSF